MMFVPRSTLRESQSAMRAIRYNPKSFGKNVSGGFYEKVAIRYACNKI